ncbi:MAG: hypothetical protein LBT47_10765 [Deltaproteobacteria bacterium]|nr:hypothetical protein [Deltaproteobacteria bacterium]
MYNYPENSGHAVAEIKVDGRWQLCDPTYGLYYTTEPGNNLNPYLLSFEELRNGGAAQPRVAKIISRHFGVDLFANPEIFIQENQPEL